MNCCRYSFNYSLECISWFTTNFPSIKEILRKIRSSRIFSSIPENSLAPFSERTTIESCRNKIFIDRHELLSLFTQLFIRLYFFVRTNISINLNNQILDYHKNEKWQEQGSRRCKFYDRISESEWRMPIIGNERACTTAPCRHFRASLSLRRFYLIVRDLDLSITGLACVDSRECYSEAFSSKTWQKKINFVWPGIWEIRGDVCNVEKIITKDWSDQRRAGLVSIAPNRIKTHYVWKTIEKKNIRFRRWRGCLAKSYKESRRQKGKGTTLHERRLRV